MAIIHDTTMNPDKLELLATWLPAQSWYLGGSRDPVLVAQLVALLQGTAQPQAQNVSNTAGTPGVTAARILAIASADPRGP